MPTISQKGLELPQSAIRKLVPFADAAKERGVHVYHLNIGQPDIETPKGALKVLSETALELPASHGVLEYSHSAGIPSYRRALCNYYHRHGIDVTPNQIIVTTGGSEALQMAFTVCLNPGDEIIIPEPYYKKMAEDKCFCGCGFSGRTYDPPDLYEFLCPVQDRGSYQFAVL